jgi:formylmethanofuran dehydrogenase subunit B
MKGVRQIADATCLACGCLCDDIALSVEKERIVKAERACPIGERWFLADRRTSLPACRIEGRPSSRCLLGSVG